MPNQITPYVDGWLGNERQLTVIPIPKFPFARQPTPDIYSREYERRYSAVPRLFVPKIARRTAWSNLLTYSEELDNAAWTATNATATVNAGTAPDGQTTLDKVLETTANAEHSLTQAATVTAAATELSVFAVGGLTRTWIRLAFIDSAATTFSAFFNIASGFIGAKSAGVTSKIVGLGNGQFRCVMQFTPAAGAGTFKVNLATDESTISYAGTTTAGAYLWGAQVSTGTETPYISTTSATRAISAPDRDDLDPMAYLVEEDDPRVESSERIDIRRGFSRIPLQQIVPGAYAFASPNFTPVNWSSAFTTVPPGSYAIAGNYAVIALASFTPSVNPVSTAICEAITGYYDVSRSITGYTGNPATVLTIASHNCIAGDRLIYRRTDGGMQKYYYFDVSSVASDDLTGTSTLVAQDTGTGAGMSQYLLPLILSATDRARKRTRARTDIGETIMLVSQTIEDYYLPGVSVGISTALDIPRQQPYQLAAYLEQWASAGTWFNVQATGLREWKGAILQATYQRALRPTS